MQMRAGLDAFFRNDEMTDVQVVTKRIWSVTRMDDADRQEGAQEGIPGLVNMYTGMDSLESIHEKIRRLQGELMWNMKVHYEY
ncbi:hypothetical protein K503DRAFT_234802 [Rhizopogon vinicolor AM-OR11-026]|uniref:Uncharacterized protein n=1 Tax=Rhizopogon vinicolor AM-OR11-026 TaxID=1314800 RepID=A0A1B7MXU9_9AGAM|nr:hypothetical protein K503DRAFT_234802 [Rhizopogon vinicolor AM-OR11-026]